MHHPVFAEDSNSPVIDRKQEGLIGMSSGSRKIFDIKNWYSTTANSEANKALLGTQTPSDDLGYIPGALCSSPKITAVMSNSTNGATFTPWQVVGKLGIFLLMRLMDLHDETQGNSANDYTRMSYIYFKQSSFDLSVLLLGMQMIKLPKK